MCSHDGLNESDIDRLCVLAGDKTVDINCTDLLGRTPLILLCQSKTFPNFLDRFEALLCREEKTTIHQDNQGKTALHWLCYTKNLTVDFVNLLAQSVNLVDLLGYNPLLCLLVENLSDCKDLVGVLRSLIDCGTDVHAETHEAYTALSLLCRFGTEERLVEAIKILAVECKIDVNRKNEHGATAFHYLCQNSSLTTARQLVDAVTVLIQCGTDVKSTDGDDDSALTLLCRYSKVS